MTDKLFRYVAMRAGAISVVIAVLAVFAGLQTTRAADETLPASDALMKACTDELDRAMSLRMEDLEKPYFIHIIVDDSLNYRMSAAYGALESSNRNRSRRLYSDVRVGDYAFDNSNFAGDGGFGRFGGRGGRGGGAARGGDGILPIDDQPLAIRQSLWSATDEDYKSAVETLAKKRAYLKDRNVKDRPEDFSKSPATTKTEPPATMAFDRAAWERNIEQLSARFRKYPLIQDSGVQLLAGLSNSYVLNSEGTRLRKADTGIVLTIHASGQADDGMHFSDNLVYAAESARDLPSIEAIGDDIDKLVAGLSSAMKAPYLENYTGPVLFDGRAAAQMFRSMLAGGLVGRPEPLGTQRRGRGGAEGLDKQLGLAILPKSFQVFDDPTVVKAGDAPLFGHYRFDDEGVPARRVDLVVNGILKDLCLSRTPTRKLSGSNGHARQAGGGGAPRAAIGCLFIEDKKAVPDVDLKKRLIDSAKDAGLEYGIRVVSLTSTGLGAGRADLAALVARGMRGGRGFGGGGGGLGDPVLAYKVFVSDGHEEPVRGCEFGEIEVKTLKKIAAAGKTQYVHNFMDAGFGGGAPAASIVAPSVLFEELELTKIEQENETLPILKAPSDRRGEALGMSDPKDR